MVNMLADSETDDYGGPRVRSTAFRIFFVAFQAIWLNAVVPGHTRGAITLCGASTATVAATDAATGPRQTACCPTKKPASDPAPAGQKSDHCAVCHFAARVTPPPAFDFTLPALARTSIRVDVLPASADSADLPPAFYGRGPPTA
jgi:hypothetical protein